MARVCLINWLMCLTSLYEGEGAVLIASPIGSGLSIYFNKGFKTGGLALALKRNLAF